MERYNRKDPYASFDVNKILPRKQYTIVNEENNKLVDKILTAEEKKLLQEFVQKLQQDFPEDVKDTTCLVSFLRARKWKLQDAEIMYRNRMRWIQEFKPHLLTEKDVAKQIAKGKGFWYGRDKLGRPVLYMRMMNHFPHDQKPEELFSFLVYMSEIGKELMPPFPNNKLVMISDRTGSSRKNVDFGALQTLCSLANYYPDVMGSIYIYGANWLYTMIYKISQQIIDPGTMSKFLVLSTDLRKATEQLLEVVDKDQLVPDIGGSENVLNFLPASTPKASVYGQSKVSSPKVATTAAASSKEEQTFSKEDEENLMQEAQQAISDSREAEKKYEHDTTVNLETLDLD